MEYKEGICEECREINKYAFRISISIKYAKDGKICSTLNASHERLRNVSMIYFNGKFYNAIAVCYTRNIQKILQFKITYVGIINIYFF